MRDHAAAIVHRAPDVGAHTFDSAVRTIFAAWSGRSFLAVTRLANLREASGDHCFQAVAELRSGGPQLGDRCHALGLNRPQLLFPFGIASAQHLP